ncbi:ATP-binding protein [Actinoplanes sp. LDG1-06]|uniref:ATP-binding protein n=1 Tax=Paractinoplanes ovalisporus TaxID=2810368 RepID=A0ABS2A363_9ACTN|nr:ATP-binding protein [Actinoplanes ovalisporus]MBM2614267.1 ATP-binding protein [Actinoplanes ovalisporus]
MSPRPGGEADKFGSRYEGAWTVSHLLHILAGTGRSIVVEKAGELDDGAEFLYTRDNDGVVEAHQLKRQNSSANSWTVKALAGEDIWTNAKKHIDAGREFHFVSTVPAVNLTELADRARRSANLDDFLKNWLNEKLRELHDALSTADIYGSPATSWAMLRQMWFRCQDERAVVSMNASMCGVLLDGDGGELAATGLGDIVVNHLGVELTSTTIESRLSTYRLKLADGSRRQSLQTRVDQITANWCASVGRELLKPTIKRAEASDLAIKARDSSSSVVFLVGTAGGGKTAVLSQAVAELLAADVPVLGFRLDRLENFAATDDIGRKLGLDVSPVSALAAAAGGKPCVLVIDQLDAVSLASGRMPTSFGAVEDLVREAAAFPSMLVVLACRQFDVDNDYRIRTLQNDLKAESLTVPDLSVETVSAAVEAMGLDQSKLQPHQVRLLRLPLHLILLAGVADEPDALNFQSTAHLFDAYWSRKRHAVAERKPGVRFNEVITTVARAISDRRRLSVSDSVLDSDELAADADALVSEHVLVRDGNQVAFFHEAFFDYAFARQWATRPQALADFLTSGEQELFRRAQVRQILHHLRERDSERYLAELETTLASPDVRFHIKETILAVLAGVAEPTSAELQIVLDAATIDADLGDRVWRMLLSTNWFDRLDGDAQIQAWLGHGTADERNRAISILGSAARVYPARVAAVLASFKDRSEYHNWLLRSMRAAELHLSRELFDLLVDAVRVGGANGDERTLWLAADSLAEHEPGWAIDLLGAYFIDRPGALAIDGEGRVEALTQNDYSLAESVRKSASSDPAKFVAIFLPYMTDVMVMTAGNEPPPGFPSDQHFSHHYDRMSETSEAENAFLAAMRLAVQAVVRSDPAATKPVLEGLAAVKLSGAQTLLYLGLIAAEAPLADWAAELLLESTDRLFCGTDSNSVWVARELIQTIGPHIDETTHQALENAVRDLRFEWEQRAAGYYAFTLLSALDPGRLTERGRRRLGEYQRKFRSELAPEPEGVTAVLIESPVGDVAASHMTDRNWLQAMARHDQDRANWATSRGGARELSHVLQRQTRENPTRFARLAVKLTTETNASYASAILIGLGEAAPVSPDDEASVFSAVRYVATLGIPETDRWIGHPLRQYLKSAPIDLVELVRDRALEAPDPASDVFDTSTGREPGDRLRFAGMNCARGALAETLGDLLIYDVDGTRTAAVVPALETLATDHVVAVRAQAAHTLAAALRFARPHAVAAFTKLVETSDELLAGRYVCRLMMYIGNGGSQNVVLPVIQRMVDSDDRAVRLRGGDLALVAAVAWGERGPFDRIMEGTDAPSRKGVAQAAAARLTSNNDPALVAETLIRLFGDSDAGVREAAAAVVAHLRGKYLSGYQGVLNELIDSAAFETATPQIFLTLEHAPDRVDALALRCVRRFIEVFGAATGDIRTGAAADARHVCNLAVRGLTQAQTPLRRSAYLDVIDALMRVGAYGIDDAVDRAER